MAWKEEVDEYRSAGFTDSEIVQEGMYVRQEMHDAGFPTQEIGSYFGEIEPDMAPMKEYFEGNLKRHAEVKAEEMKGKTIDPDLAGMISEPDHADTFTEALEAGWQTSVTGLLVNGGKPNIDVDADAPRYFKIASQVAHLAGDAPAMLAGLLAGAPVGAAVGGVSMAAAGSVVPVAGTVAGLGVGAGAGAIVGGGAGAMALPEAIRTTLMQHYEKGDIKDFGDFWDRSSAVFLATMKGAVIGGATAGVGGAVGKAVAPLSSGVARGTAVASSEILTMVSVGKALEGEMPNADDFLDAAILVGGMHGMTRVAAKARKVFAKTGVKPEELVQMAEVDPVLKMELLSDNVEVPTSLMPKGKETLVADQAGKIELKSEAEPPAPIRSEATEKILSQVGEKKAAPKKSYDWNTFYKDWFDKFNPLKVAEKQLGNKKTDAIDSPHKLAQMADDAPAKVTRMIENGVFEFATGRKTGKSLNEIVKPFGKDISSFKAYLIAKRAVELNKRGIENVFDLEASKTVVKEGSAKYEAAAKDIVEFQNGVLRYLKDSGRYAEADLVNMMEANKDYVSFKQVAEEGAAPKRSSGKPIHEIKGTTEGKIQDPLLSILENTEHFIKLAERNRAVEALVKLAEKAPDQTVIERVLPDGKGNIGSVLAPDQFAVYRNGERQVYRATDPMVAEAFKAMEGNAPSQNIIWKLARGFTAVKKIGITFMPDFLIKNKIRDEIMSGTLTKGHAIPFVDAFVAMKEAVGKTDKYWEWMSSGGANGSFIDIQKSYGTMDIYGLNKKTGFMNGFRNVIKKPIEMAALTAKLIEQGPRFAEYKRVSGKNPTQREMMRGGHASREVTLDFSRMGARISALNSITAFQNVSMQGLDRSIRALKEDPKAVAKRAAMYITAPSILLWYANKDDQRVKELSRVDKDLNWIIATDDWQKVEAEEADEVPDYLIRPGADGGIEMNKGTLFRIPKPQELGILFGSLPERLLEQFFTDNPRAMKDFEATMVELVTPAFLPDLSAPMFEQNFNESFFKGKNIVPHHLEGQLPEAQYTDYTSESAKVLGKFLGFIGGNKIGPEKTPISSPMIIENYVRSWTGPMGMYALQTFDKILTSTGAIKVPPSPERTLADIPFVKAFVLRYPSASAQSIQDFYKNFAAHERVIDTVDGYVKRNNPEAAIALMEEQPDKMIKLEGIKQVLSNHAYMIHVVNADEDYTPEDKRRQIDMLYHNMILMAREGNAMVEETRKALKGP